MLNGFKHTGGDTAGQSRAAHMRHYKYMFSISLFYIKKKLNVITLSLLLSLTGKAQLNLHCPLQTYCHSKQKNHQCLFVHGSSLLPAASSKGIIPFMLPPAYVQTKFYVHLKMTSHLNENSTST